MSNRFFGLVGRFLNERSRGWAYAQQPRTLGGNAFGAAHVLTGDQIDSIWLQRVELRSPLQIGDLLDRSGFASRPDCMSAIFVDEKCGLICAEAIERKRHKDINQTAHAILRLASSYHASAVILATNDRAGRLSRSRSIHDLIMKLYHTGDAINVPLLDHVSLTASGWRSMFTPKRPAA